MPLDMLYIAKWDGRRSRKLMSQSSGLLQESGGCGGKAKEPGQGISRSRSNAVYIPAANPATWVTYKLEFGDGNQVLNACCSVNLGSVMIASPSTPSPPLYKHHTSMIKKSGLFFPEKDNLTHTHTL